MQRNWRQSILSGRVLTTDTGRESGAPDLYYYRARYYDPTLGRFISEEPIGFASGDFSWYRYVMNSPVNKIDPTGLFDLDCLKKCVVKHYLPASIGAPLIAGGLPLVGKEKASGAFGSSQNTSWFSNKFGNKGKFGRWPTFAGFPPQLKWTPYFGRAVARWLPFVGWGLLGYDAYKIYQCMDRCENNECQKR